jgi:hypothetical protein
VATVCKHCAVYLQADRQLCDRLALQGSGTQITREMETQVLITALALPYGGKILFAATETGAVRCYRYPLTGVLCTSALNDWRLATRQLC